MGIYEAEIASAKVSIERGQALLELHCCRDAEAVAEGLVDVLRLRTTPVAAEKFAKAILSAVRPQALKAAE